LKLESSALDEIVGEETDEVDITIIEHRINAIQSLLSPNQQSPGLTFTSHHQILPDTIQPGLFALIGLLLLIIGLIVFAYLRRRDGGANSIKPMGEP
jgi:uncharacterized membrane protein